MHQHTPNKSYAGGGRKMLLGTIRAMHFEGRRRRRGVWMVPTHFLRGGLPYDLVGTVGRPNGHQPEPVRILWAAVAAQVVKRSPRGSPERSADALETLRALWCRRFV